MRSLLPLLLFPAWTVHALRIDVTGRSVALLKSINANVLAAEDHSDEIISTRDVLYMANVTIEGKSYPLQMDTGSSDLWVDMGSATPANPTSNTLNLTYGTGNVYGPIAHGPVSFAGYDLPDQAYLVFQSGQNPVFSFGAQGIIGLGFTTLSHIDAAVSESWANSLLYNIFAQNPSEPNFIAMALERDSDEHNTVHGSLGVGELSKEYESISDTEHIPLFPPEGSKRWTVLLDSYAVNGATQNATSTVNDVPTGRLSVLLDSGTTYTYAPPEIASSIYSSVSGAFLNSTTNQWVVPCSAGIRLTLWIAGRAFDIHPLDVVVPSLADPSVCIGSFIPTRIAVGASDFDWILGTNILRSMYCVYDFGDFDSNNVMGNPYVQLLSVIEIGDAASAFQAARGGAVPINSGNGAASVSVSVMTTSQKLDKLMDLIPLMFAALGANALILLTILGIGIWLCCRMRKQNDRKPRTAPLPLTTVASSNHAYEAVATADDEGGRPSSVHTRRSTRMLSRSGSKHSLSSRSIKNEGDLLLRPSITLNRNDDNASIRSGRVPVGGDASRRGSRLTPPDGSPSPSARQSRFPSNMAPNPSTPLSNTFSTSQNPDKISPEEDMTDVIMLQPHKESLEDEKTGDVSLAKGKRSSFRPPPPIVAPGYRQSMHSEFSASPTVAGSEYHHGARERTMSSHIEVPVRQGSHNSDTSQPSPTESSYQDARQSYYSHANGSLPAFPVDTPNTGRTSMMVPSPNSAASPAVAVDNIHTIPEASSSHRRTASRQEAQRAAFLATLDEPLPPPRRPRAQSRGLQVAQDNGGRMSAYHARSPSQDVQFPSQPNRHSYAPAPAPNSPGFVGGRGYPPAAEGSGPQRSSYVPGSSMRRGPFVSTPSPFNPSSPATPGSNAPSRAPPAPPS